jgi:chromosome segregation ATPase
MDAAHEEFPPMAPEVQEAKDIYEAKIEHKMHVLGSYKLEFPGVEEEVAAEFESMDEMYDEFESQLSHGSENEKVISALIESYQLKLEILEDILENLETEKNENDENINP